MSAVTSIEPRSLESEQERASPALIRPFRAANDFLDKTIAHDGAEVVAYFCECEHGDCYAPVWLTSVEYRGLVALGAGIRSADHG